jgi:hypothetical protein
LPERLEHTLGIFGVDANTGILYFEQHTEISCARDAAYTTTLSKFDCVTQQVEQNLPRLTAVSANDRVFTVYGHGKFDGFPIGDRFDHRSHFLHQIPDRHRLHPNFFPSCFDARERKNFFNYAQQMPCAGTDALQLLDLTAVDRTGNAQLHEFGITEDGVKRSAQLMRHRRKKCGLGHTGVTRFLIQPCVIDN